ncbi:hypothetical protein BAE44_0022138, partial [Dichanthelium oligosanthes]
MATTPPAAAILGTLGDFTSRENWDKFFALRGTGDNFEWYAEWPNLRAPLLSLLGDRGAAADAGAAVAPEILVPACGSSALSERLYDAGFRRITNVDFSRVVVADMLRRHARARPEMRWRVMDVTDMQNHELDVVGDASFDVVLDKGGLDALMEPGAGTKLGTKYLNEVALLLSEFRFGWDMIIQAIATESSKKSTFQTFMVVMMKGKMGVVQTIKSSLDQSAEYCNMKQANAVIRALGNENIIRESYSSGVDVLLSLRDLQLGAIGDLKARAQEWLFASEEGQWHLVESAKAARLIMVFLDSRHANIDMDVIKKDLSPLVKDLEPGNPEEEAPIPFMMAGDGVKQRDILEESTDILCCIWKATSEITGPMVVEDVVYENADGDQGSMSEKMFRRLIFGRSSGLVQSEALLVRDPQSDETDKKNKSASATSKKRRNQKKDLLQNLYDFAAFLIALLVDHIGNPRSFNLN